METFDIEYCRLLLVHGDLFNGCLKLIKEVKYEILNEDTSFIPQGMYEQAFIDAAIFFIEYEDIIQGMDFHSSDTNYTIANLLYIKETK